MKSSSSSSSSYSIRLLRVYKGSGVWGGGRTSKDAGEAGDAGETGDVGPEPVRSGLCDMSSTLKAPDSTAWTNQSKMNSRFASNADTVSPISSSSFRIVRQTVRSFDDRLSTL